MILSLAFFLVLSTYKKEDMFNLFKRECDLSHEEKIREISMRILQKRKEDRRRKKLNWFL